MKTKTLALVLQRMNRKKKRVQVGNAREDVGNLSDLFYQYCRPVFAGTKIIGVYGDIPVELFKNGQRRANRGKKK